MPVEAGLARAFAVFALAIAGERDQHGIGGIRRGAQAARELVAVHVGQADIEQHDLGPFAQGARQAARAVVLDAHQVAVGLEQRGEHLRGVGIVVHHQHPHRTFIGLVRRLPCLLRLATRQQRQADHEFAALVRPLAEGRHPPAMQRHQAFHQRQADAQAALRAVRRALGLREQVEDIGQHLRLDALPVVAYRDHGFAAFAGHAQGDLAARRRVLGGVIQDVRDHLHQARTVARHVQRLLPLLYPQLVALHVEQRAHLFDGAVDDCGDVEVFLLDLGQAAGDARDVQQVVHQVGHVLGLAHDDVAGVARALRVERAALQELGGGRDRRQRVAQLVRQHRQELVLLAVGGAQLVLDALAHGDVAAFHEDALDVALRAADRLVHEVDEALFQRRAGFALDAHRHRMAHERLARLVDLVEQLEEALVRDLGQRLARRLADQLAAADQLQVGLVGDLEHVIRAAQHGEDAGRLLEQAHQALVLLFAVAFRQHFAGHLDAGAIHAGHGAVLVAHRRVREAEPGVLVVAVAVHAQRQPVHVGGFALERAHDQRMDVVPDLTPDVVEAVTQRRGMLFAEDDRVGVVVQEAQLRPPGHEHRELRVEHQADRGAQRLGPGTRMPERGMRPVVRPHHGSHLPAPAQEGQPFGRSLVFGFHAWVNTDVVAAVRMPKVCQKEGIFPRTAGLIVSGRTRGCRPAASRPTSRSGSGPSGARRRS